jgi:hypothetical protein
LDNRQPVTLLFMDLLSGHRTFAWLRMIARRTTVGWKRRPHHAELSSGVRVGPRPAQPACSAASTCRCWYQSLLGGRRCREQTLAPGLPLGSRRLQQRLQQRAGRRDMAAVVAAYGAALSRFPALTKYCTTFWICCASVFMSQRCVA